MLDGALSESKPVLQIFAEPRSYSGNLRFGPLGWLSSLPVVAYNDLAKVCN